MKKWLVAVLVGLIFAVAPPPGAAAPAPPCLPLGLSAADVASWVEVGRQVVVADGENGTLRPVSLVLYQTGSGPVVLAAVGDLFVFFDPAPNDPSVPGLVNEQMFTPENLLRFAPIGACKWRSTKGGQSA